MLDATVLDSKPPASICDWVEDDLLCLWGTVTTGVPGAGVGARLGGDPTGIFYKDSLSRIIQDSKVNQELAETGYATDTGHVNTQYIIIVTEMKNNYVFARMDAAATIIFRSGKMWCPFEQLR